MPQSNLLVGTAPLLMICLALWTVSQPVALAQTRLPPVTTLPSLPEPIYWKQDLFLIPYQWSSPGEVGVAQSVWLYVSKDRGATWQKISEARPNVTSFNYRAEGDGEYWFAVRTIDIHGRPWPAGAYQAELRVVVDTQMPQFTHLTATEFNNGVIEIAWQASDANLDPTSLKVEAQVAAGTWQPVTVQSISAFAQPGGGNEDTLQSASPRRAYCQPPAGSRPLAVRATISDMAGNPASYQTQIQAAPAGAVAPTNSAGPSSNFATGSIDSASGVPPTGWVSSSVAAQPAPAQPTSQHWPALTTNRAPFRLFSSGQALPDDGVTAYGNPPTISDIAVTDHPAEPTPGRVESRYAGPVVRELEKPALGETPAWNRSQQDYTPLEPFRKASTQQLAPAGSPLSVSPRTPVSGFEQTPTPPIEPKRVGSRTFALEYDVDEAGRWGFTKVELWGTRNGGQTWHSYARDDDNRSPLIVTVDEEGMYGFRIAVESTGAVAQVPSAGDEPELWVDVDLERPVIELTSIERGEGNLADHLILHWRAADDNLQPRPISLFYSSRPAAPWSAIAVNLENTGEYAWRVERHVPSRIFLRLEARDMAGNLAAYQTREATEFSPSIPGAHLHDAEAWGPTAAGTDPPFAR